MVHYKQACTVFKNPYLQCSCAYNHCDGGDVTVYCNHKYNVVNIFKDKKKR